VVPATPLAQFIVAARSWSPEAFWELIVELRVNERSYHTHLGLHGWFRQTILVEDLVRTYSYYVRSVVLDPRIEHGVCQDGSEESGPIGVQLRRNRSAWDVHSVLEPIGYRFNDRIL
jgi:hypothetical protein